MGVQEYVGRIKEFGRSERRHSSFYTGLYGQVWVNFMAQCTVAVSELVRLTFNKRKYYHRGAPLALTLPPLPDMVVGDIVAPVEGFSGQ